MSPDKAVHGVCVALALGSVIGSLALVSTEDAGKTPLVTRGRPAAGKSPEIDHELLQPTQVSGRVPAEEAIVVAEREPGPRACREVRGRVYDDGGLALGGVELSCASEFAAGPRALARDLGVSDADGRFCVPVPEGWLLDFRLRGHRARQLRPSALDGPGRTGCVVVLPRQVRLRGVVREPGSKGVAGARLVLTTLDDQVPKRDLIELSGGDGSFCFHEAERGEARLRVEAVGWPVSVEQLSIEAGRPAILIDLSPGGAVHGRVRSEGRPVVGVEVRVSTGAHQVARSVRTDDGGGFELAGLPAGTCFLECTEGLGAPTQRRRLVIAEGEVLEVSLDLPSRPCCLSGSLRDGETAIGGVLTTWRLPSGTGEAGLQSESCLPRIASVQADGGFSFEGLESGTRAMVLRAWTGDRRPAHRAWLLDLWEGQWRFLSCHDSAYAVDGRLVDYEALCTSMELILSQLVGEGSVELARSCDDVLALSPTGSFDAGDLFPGRYRLDAELDGDRQQLAVFTVLDQSQSLELRLPMGWRQGR